MKPDASEMRRALDALLHPGDVIEVRVPRTERTGTISGYFNDSEKLIKAVTKLNGDFPGIYITLNPVNPALLARAANRLKYRARETTQDDQIPTRVRLLVDCDPKRPAGISSTDEQHDAGLQKAREVRFVLSEEGWPDPICADSGNGGHLVYFVDLPNDEASAKLIERVLAGLAQRFDDPVVQIDKAVFNASRIFKLYGTPAGKGDSIPGYPHRLSRILDIPAEIVPVSQELLEQIAVAVSEAPRQLQQPTDSAHRAAKFDIEEFLHRYLQPHEPVPHGGGRKWVLEECPFNPDHQAPDAAVFERSDGILGFRCLHNSCAGKGWKDVRALYEPRSSKSGQQSKASPPPKASAADAPQVLEYVHVIEISAPTEDMLFDGYPLPARGLTLKVGAARSGKTLLAIQEAIAVMRSRPLFGRYPCLRDGPVMIIAPDDPNSAASIKAVLVRSGVSSEVTDLPLFVVPRLPFGFGQGLLDWLEEQITRRNLRMVIIDSYTAMRGPRVGGTDIVKAEHTELTQLDDMAKRIGCCIQVIHHGSKGAASLDWTQSAAGTFVMAAATEAQIHVSRFNELDSSATERLIRIRGRHSADAEIVLKFRKESLDYEYVLEGGTAPFYPDLLKIKLAVGMEPFSAKDLALKLDISRSQAHRQIERLMRTGALQRSVLRGQYVCTEGYRHEGVVQ